MVCSFPLFVLQTSRGEDVVQGLSLSSGHIRVPEVHHEHHPRAVLWVTLMKGPMEEGVIKQKTAALRPTLRFSTNNKLTGGGHF